VIRCTIVLKEINKQQMAAKTHLTKFRRRYMSESEIAVIQSPIPSRLGEVYHSLNTDQIFLGSLISMRLATTILKSSLICILF
jgi:hypothetical protein